MGNRRTFKLEQDLLLIDCGQCKKEYVLFEAVDHDLYEKSNSRFCPFCGWKNVSVILGEDEHQRKMRLYMAVQHLRSAFSKHAWFAGIATGEDENSLVIRCSDTPTLRITDYDGFIIRMVEEPQEGQQGKDHETDL